MSSSSEREIEKIILEHALKDQENLATTLDIGFAFPELRKRIIVGFLDKLERFVLENLGDLDATEWKVSGNLRCSPLERYAFFSFGKEKWENQYGVGLQPQEANAGHVIIGVWRQYDDKTKEGAPRFQPEDLLYKKLNKIRQGKYNNYWEWYHDLDTPYRNWNRKEALIKLHNGEAVKYLGQYLVEIIKVAEQVIDDHVGQS